MSTIFPSSYTTVEDIYQTLPQVGSVSNVTSKNIQYQIGVVEANMNARLSKAYTLPMSQAVLQLTAIATQLTIHELMKRFTSLKKLKEQTNDSTYKDAMGLLDDIVVGRTPLIDAYFVVIAKKSGSGQSAFSNNMNYEPTFGENDYVGSIVDDEKFN